MAIPSLSEIKKLTPMMQQYYALKNQCIGAILFFRMGDFFEVFGDDAEEVAPKLEIMMTSRERGDNKKIPFCGVPHHSAKNHWMKLLKMGYKVAIADQVEASSEAAKGALVKRDIIKIMTPGCLDDLDGLDASKPNYVMGVYQKPSSKEWAVFVADVSTGEFRLGVTQLEDLLSLVELFRPKELLVRQFCKQMVSEALGLYLSRERLLLEELEESVLRDELYQRKILEQSFSATILAEPLLGETPGGFELVASFFHHLKKMKVVSEQFLTLKTLFEPSAMRLDDTSIRDLELFETARHRDYRGSLLERINYCLTPMGKRLLRWTLSHPLLNKEEITKRHDAVEILTQQKVALHHLRDFFKNSFDLERLITKIMSGLVSPIELGKVRSSLKTAEALHELLNSLSTSSGQLPSIKKALSFYCSPLSLLQQCLQEEPTLLGKGSGVFKRGYDVALDKYVDLSENGQNAIDIYEKSLRDQYEINSLKIKFHQTFGLLIEVTKANLSKVPEAFIRRQTMVNCERFVTMELKELEQTLLASDDEKIAREKELYSRLLQEISSFRENLKEISQAIAELDLLQSHAWLAITKKYCRPNLEYPTFLKLKNVRHPVVEHFVGESHFVANDIEMSEEKKMILLTGPNMAGKSTIMRQVALCALLNQSGSFVPAEEAFLPIFDKVFTRVGASDDLASGMSTFMVEMSESAHILRQATAQSFVILDEIGRGTSTQDGLAIASAILENLAVDKRSWVMFATHYHELVPFAKNLEGIQVKKTQVLEDDHKIKFTHRVIDGACDHSYGIEVANLAGIPHKIIQRAKELISFHASSHHEIPDQSKSSGFSSAERSALQKLNYFSEKMKSFQINSLTPIQSLNILSDLKLFFESNEPLHFQQSKHTVENEFIRSSTN